MPDCLHPVVRYRLRRGAPLCRKFQDSRLFGLLLVLIGVLWLNGCTTTSATPVTLHAENPLTLAGQNLLVVIVATSTPISNTLPVDRQLQARLATIQSDQLLFIVDALSAMGTRHVLSSGFDPAQGIGIGAARNFLLDQFRSLPAALPLSIWTQPVGVRINGVTTLSDNVIAVVQGTDLNAGVVVVGAHYDSINASDSQSADLAAPGADDNGSGVAALLELARLIALTPLRATVIFVAFTAEETGRQGSSAFIRSYLQAQTPPIVPRAMLNLDTLGADSLSSGAPQTFATDTDDPAHALPGSLRVFSADPNDSPSRQLARQIELSAAPYPALPRVIVQSSAERIGRFGDQQPFSATGIAAVHLIEGVEDPTRQRSATDTGDAIQPAYLIGATGVAFVALLSLADGLAPPQSVQWQAADHALCWSPVPAAAGYVITVRHNDSASIEQMIVSGTAPIFQWDGLAHYDFAAVAAFDQSGRIGSLAPEVHLSAPF